MNGIRFVYEYGVAHVPIYVCSPNSIESALLDIAGFAVVCVSTSLTVQIHCYQFEVKQVVSLHIYRL
jgi:hypothetical protein